MSPKNNISGQKYGRLTVLGSSIKTEKNKLLWDCLCDCGQSKRVSSVHLRSGHTQSCGCIQKEKLAERNRLSSGILKPISEAAQLKWIGHRTGKLVVLSLQGRQWRCICDCGAEKLVSTKALAASKVKSCGCLRREKTASRARTHGCTSSEGKRKLTAEYRTWLAIKTRCNSKYTNRDDYNLYAGRGITICDRWKESFENFLADVGPKPSPQHSIDRIDVDGNYEPSNVRWATAREQALNTRRSRSYKDRSAA